MMEVLTAQFQSQSFVLQLNKAMKNWRQMGVRNSLRANHSSTLELQFGYWIIMKEPAFDKTILFIEFLFWESWVGPLTLNSLFQNIGSSFPFFVRTIKESS